MEDPSTDPKTQAFDRVARLLLQPDDFDLQNYILGELKKDAEKVWNIVLAFRIAYDKSLPLQDRKDAADIIIAFANIP